MKAAAIFLFGLAATLGACAHQPGTATDPNRLRTDAGVYHPDNNAAQRERFLNGAGSGVQGSGIGAS